MNTPNPSAIPFNDAEALFVNLLLDKCEVFKSYESQIEQTSDMGSRPCIELFQMLLNADKQAPLQMGQSLN